MFNEAIGISLGPKVRERGDGRDNEREEWMERIVMDSWCRNLGFQQRLDFTWEACT